MRKPLTLHRILGASVAALAVAGALASPVQAAPGTARAAAPTPVKAAEQPVLGAVDPGHAHNVKLTTDKRPPQASSSEQLRSDYSKPQPRGLAATAAAAPCNAADFAAKTGADLVDYIKSVPVTCTYTLFNLPENQANAVFREAKMVTVADAYKASSAAYAGDNSGSTLQLVMFLRAGYYVQYSYPDATGAYGAPLKTAIRGGLDAFFANSHMLDVNDAHGQTLAESVILIDSADEQGRYLNVIKKLLNAYNSSYDAYYYMKTAVNNVYTPLFRGHQNDDFVNAVIADPSVIDTLNSFALGHLDLLGTDRSYLTSNAGRELTRFVRHSALQAKVRPLAKGLLGASSMTGPTAALWVGVAENASYFDSANCGYYDVCNLSQKLTDAVLSVRHTCSPTLKIRAQEMTAAQLAATCQSLASQDAYFFNVAGTNTPVANDNNTSLEVNAFNSSADYKAYAGVIFDIDTNNGGMYLEGNPATQGNQPRFIAYEAEWLRPEFAIWNLNHEYTHYLDGRFNMHGDFSAGMTTPTVMWVEGFAEYISYSYRNEVYSRAVTEAGKNTYPLSTLFDTTYNNSDSTRVYQWGYLAVRYMLEKHRPDVVTLLGHYRTGNWAAARTLLKTTIGTRYDADFASWLAACASGGCTNTNKAPVAAFDAATSGLTVTLTDKSADADGTIASRSWNFGDGQTSAAASPSHSYAAAGSYTITLTVTDDKGLSATATKTVTVAGLPQCGAVDIRELGKNCQRNGFSANKGDLVYFYVYLPAGVTTLTVTTSGGTGNADLYYNSGAWATRTKYSARSVTAGNGETLTVKNPSAGYRYVSLYATDSFSNVSIATQF
ncbi:collagenase [Longispora albida]|uniref:collagenase n=1 Tax=Longispora albida TaxID=203523 RepID=UPI00037B7BB2|nr:collagenase [Longispora albida]